MKITTTHALRRKAALAAILLTITMLAGVFAATLQTSFAAQVNSTAVFVRRYDNALRSLSAFTSRDPFTGQQLTSPQGLEFLFVDSPGSLQAFCVQKGMFIYDTGQITRRAHAMTDSMFAGLPAQSRENILLTALFGYPNRSPAELNTNARVAQAATQILMWESQLGYRDAFFNRTDDRVFNAYFAGGNMANVRAVYDAIALAIQQFHRVPSFFAAGTLQLNLVYNSATGTYTQVFTDTAGSNAELAITGNNPDGISITRSGDVYTFSAAQTPLHGGALTITRTDIPRARTDALGPPLFWVDPCRGLHNQILFTGVEPRARSWPAALIPVEPPTTTTTEPSTTTTEPSTTEQATTTLPETTTTTTTTTTVAITTTTTASTTTTITTTTTTAPPSTIPTTTTTRTTTTRLKTTAPTTTTTEQSASATAKPEPPPPTGAALPGLWLLLVGTGATAAFGAGALKKKDQN